MKRLLVLLAALLLVGCEKPAEVHWCDKLPEQNILVRLPGWIPPIRAVVKSVTTNRDGCWYSIWITDDEHIQPRNFIIHERYVI